MNHAVHAFFLLALDADAASSFLSFSLLSQYVALTKIKLI